VQMAVFNFIAKYSPQLGINARMTGISIRQYHWRNDVIRYRLCR